MRRSPGSFRSTFRRTSRRTVSSQTPNAVALRLMLSVRHSGFIVAFIMRIHFKQQERPTRPLSLQRQACQPNQRLICHRRDCFPKSRRRPLVLYLGRRARACPEPRAVGQPVDVARQRHGGSRLWFRLHRSARGAASIASQWKIVSGLFRLRHRKARLQTRNADRRNQRRPAESAVMETISPTGFRA